MSYRNPVITRRFDELVEDGDHCHVIIRNPKTMPGTELTAMAGDDDAEGDGAGAQFGSLLEVFDADVKSALAGDAAALPAAITALVEKLRADAGQVAAPQDGDATGGNVKLKRIHQMIARLVIGWRVWDPTVPIKADPETGELIHDDETAPRLLPLPATAESVAKLPQAILMDLMTQVTSAVNPNQSPAGTTGSPS
jgi:hypothetical protein